jgi:hypothetical protein
MISANIFSMNTAYEYSLTVNTTAESHNSYSNSQPGPTGDWYHGSYFLQFGMLQIAMDCDALALVDTFKDLAVSNAEGFNAEAAVRVPTMYYVETRQWSVMAEFNLSTFYDIDYGFWSGNVWTEINSNMLVTVARSILNYPIEEISRSRQAVDNANMTLLLDPLWSRHQLPYWRLSFNIMVMSARAWEAFRMTSYDVGISMMEEIRQLQAVSWAPEVSHAWDANEQLAEMLLMRNEEGDTLHALEVYEDAIATYPNRYRSIAGAAKCAHVLGNDVKASRYYGDVSSRYTISHHSRYSTTQHNTITCITE